MREYPPPRPLSLCITERQVGDHCSLEVESNFRKEEHDSLTLHLLFRTIVLTYFCVSLRGTAFLLRLISHTSITTPSANRNFHYSFSRSLSPSNSDVPSGGGAFRVHISTTSWASFAVSVKLRHYHKKVGHLTFTAKQRAGHPLY